MNKPTRYIIIGIKMHSKLEKDILHSPNYISVILHRFHYILQCYGTDIYWQRITPLLLETYTYKENDKNHGRWAGARNQKPLDMEHIWWCHGHYISLFSWRQNTGKWISKVYSEKKKKKQQSLPLIHSSMVGI